MLFRLRDYFATQTRHGVMSNEASDIYVQSWVLRSTRARLEARQRPLAAGPTASHGQPITRDSVLKRKS